MKFRMGRLDVGMPVLAIEDERIGWTRSFRCLLSRFAVLVGDDGEPPRFESRPHMNGHILDVLGHRYLCSDKFACCWSAL